MKWGAGEEINTRLAGRTFPHFVLLHSEKTKNASMCFFCIFQRLNQKIECPVVWSSTSRTAIYPQHVLTSVRIKIDDIDPYEKILEMKIRRSDDHDPMGDVKALRVQLISIPKFYHSFRVDFRWCILHDMCSLRIFKMTLSFMYVCSNWSKLYTFRSKMTPQQPMTGGSAICCAPLYVQDNFRRLVDFRAMF
jgi:hypothetical protein